MGEGGPHLGDLRSPQWVELSGPGPGPDLSPGVRLARPECIRLAYVTWGAR
jgi:hypothetical protein